MDARYIMHVDGVSLDPFASELWTEHVNPVNSRLHHIHLIGDEHPHFDLKMR